jgi:hypothetical protein
MRGSDNAMPLGFGDRVAQVEPTLAGLGGLLGRATTYVTMAELSLEKGVLVPGAPVKVWCFYTLLKYCFRCCVLACRYLV